MDPLDRLVHAGAGLLARVDDTLARSGAPGGHPIWPLLRRLRALPGEAVVAVAAFDPAPLTAAGSALRDLRPGYARSHAAVARSVEWQGAGADAFDAHRAALAAYLATDPTDPDTLGGRLAATIGYADAVADWLAHSRSVVARTLAEVLTCAEAVTLGTAPVSDATADPVVAGAAARIGATLLSTVLDVHDRGEDLIRRHGPGLAELPYRGPSDVAPRLEAITRIRL